MQDRKAEGERKSSIFRCLSLSVSLGDNVLHLVGRGVCVMPAVAGEGEQVELAQLTSHL